MTKKKYEPLTTGSDWTFDLIDQYFTHIERIAKSHGLDAYPNQIEIISSEQMLDAYCSVGMPINYSHWSFGKKFADQMDNYKRGRMGLAYEIVINSKPCISYLMEENTMMMQILVMAHAAFGHNSFFKNNHMFRQWTDAESIIDYLSFAKKYVSDCEDRYGESAVEEVLDSCHALGLYGVDKYKQAKKLSAAQEEQRTSDRNEQVQRDLNDLWRTIPKPEPGIKLNTDRKFPKEPQENVLKFIEKNAPNLDEWKRELIRIVRKISQYFYPQMQTQVMNEGWATFWHYTIMHDLYEEGLIPEGYMMEFYQSHTGVIMQPAFDSPYFSGLNPYAVGFAMFQDIKRVSTDPTEEDREWFLDQDWVGDGDWHKTLNWAMKGFKDESFVQQFLSPKVMRDLKLFVILDDESSNELEVAAIHNKVGYKRIRDAMAISYNIGYKIPDIQVDSVDLWGDRAITLRHNIVNGRPLEKQNTTEVLKHLQRLWGYDVTLESVDSKGDTSIVFRLGDKGSSMDIFITNE